MPLGSFPSSHLPFRVSLPPAPLHCTLSLPQTIPCFAAFRRSRLHSLLFVPLGYPPGAAGDDALCAWPTHGCLTHGLVWWSDRFSRLCIPMPGTAALFFDWRTLPARRGASKRSRLDDHGPLQDPRDRQSGRVKAFLTRCSVRCWFLHTIENRLPSPGGTHKENLP